MKKIVVTGHSKGIGEAIYNHFASDSNNTVVGFSRSNGFNIVDPSIRAKIIELSADADIFVNNAYNYCDDSQTFMLEELYASWANQNKTIINLSSIVTVNKKTTKYVLTKRRLDKFCRQKTWSEPHIINLKPSWVMVDRVKDLMKGQPYMTTDQLIEVIDFCIKSPLKIKSITFGG